ncbi:MAG: 30S ribosomal protein S20 [Erysipelotrichaceae bacterium]|nr:30S ribosomal protein S20 [Erysipelotrichaceae bacterium]
MPNIKSQKKRSITNIKRGAAIKAQKSELKTLIKNVLKAVELNDKDVAVVAYNEVSSKLDKSVTSNIHHKNYVSRQKARLSKAVNSMQ